MKTKVLFIGTRPIIPMKDGRTVLINQYCTQFTTALHYEVYFAHFGKSEDMQPDYFVQIFALEEPGIFEKMWNVFLKSLLFRRWPMQASLTYSKKTKKKIHQIVEAISPQIIICDMARLAPYICNLDENKIFKILDMDDLLSKRYYRQAQMGALDESVLGQFRNKVPVVVCWLVVKLKLMKRLLLFEAKILEKYEIKIAEKFQEIFFCSPKDTEEFNKKSIKKARCIHVAVDAEYFSSCENVMEDSKKLAYLGNVDIAANRDSVRYLLNEVMPKLVKIDNRYCLQVIGNCSKETYREFCDCPYVNFTFRVDDIRPYVKECMALVAPIQYGSGIKIKIVEAMAMGIPVITNKYGIEGLSVSHGREILVCETPDEIIEAVFYLASHMDYRKKIIETAVEYIEKNHSLACCRKELEELVSERTLEDKRKNV